MSTDLQEVAPREAALPDSRMRARAWRLAAWLALVGGALCVYWFSDAPQDFKNSAATVAIILAIAGVSLWTMRNAGGSHGRRWAWAALAWTPLLMVSPVGPIKLVLNGNVGVDGWSWRWSLQPDELLEVALPSNAALAWRTTPHDYPAFLGGNYWAEVRGVRLDPDWSARPPRQLWRQPIGAGWSSFAVVGDYAVTQEQRGQKELIVCYELKTGRVAWTHADQVRWDPSGNGALGKVGPRATPTIHEGRVYAHGATGILNCLEAATGRLVWSHDTLAEEGAENVMWGKAGSPIVVDDWIVVSVGGSDDNSLVAYDLKTGRKAWGAGRRRSSYATPVLAEIAGVRQIIVVNEEAVTSHRAADGRELWEHPWPGDSGSNASASQPVPIGDNRILLTKGYSVPAELIEASMSAEGEWSLSRVWRKPVLRTKMSNVLIRDDSAYAISDIDLECVDLETARRTWKSRRRPEIGNGQILLVGDHILALCESGEVVLVEASPKRFHELGSFQAIEGITWNNPALSGRYLLVRNAEEAACFELPVIGDGVDSLAVGVMASRP
jgi:outer membrane protein assembly factor BamB